jgi:hypothetical protein
MKNITGAFILTLFYSTTTNAFGPQAITSFTATRLTPLSAYVPSGLSADEYQKIKQADRKKIGKDLGRLGPRGFKSRSMQAWQEAYEKGLAEHYVAPVGYKKLLKEGKITKKDVPYMLRAGGKWDNSDVAGAKRKQWLRSDKEYARGGYKKEQSVSILGSGPGFDWAGTRSREDKLKNRRVFPGLS